MKVVRLELTVPDNLAYEVANTLSAIYVRPGQVPWPPERTAAIVEVLDSEQVRPPRRGLEWHEGTHPWSEHDGWPRHQHSLNGAVTIDPHSTMLHFQGSEFTA